MSMDLSVWSDCEIDLKNTLPNQSAWVVYDTEYAYEQDAWQILVMPGEDEEPDDFVLQKLPNAKHVYYITLEPIGASNEGYDLLEQVTRSLAKVCNGIWVSPNNTAYKSEEGSFE